MMTVDPDHPIASELDRLNDTVEELLRRVDVIEHALVRAGRRASGRDWSAL